jgi:hypothetical protein
MIYHKLTNANASLITATTTASSLKDLIDAAAATGDFNIDGLDGADLLIETAQTVRILFDGTTPTTAKGILMAQNNKLMLRNTDLSKVRIITTAATCAIGIQVGKSSPGETTVWSV